MPDSKSGQTQEVCGISNLGGEKNHKDKKGSCIHKFFFSRDAPWGQKVLSKYKVQSSKDKIPHSDKVLEEESRATTLKHICVMFFYLTKP